MARSSRRRNTRTRRTKTVTVYAPRSVYIPPMLDYSPPRPRRRARRHVRVPLRAPREPVQRRTVRIRLPRQYPKQRPSYVMADPKRNRINIYSDRKTKALLAREHNRKRNSERKSNRAKYSANQLDSLRRDRKGIVGATLRRGSALQLADAAMVARALDYDR